MHQTGFLHSDVKPNNVVFDAYLDVDDLYAIGPDGSVTVNEGAKVYLLDFGLSERYLKTNGSHVAFEKINR